MSIERFKFNPSTPRRFPLRFYADEVPFEPAGTILLSTNVQDALEELAAMQHSSYVFNGDFQFWQMGFASTALAAASGYLLPDMWCYYAGGNFAQYTQSRQTSGLERTTYCLRYARNAGGTDVTTQFVIHDMESFDSIPYQGHQLTVSCYIRTGANFSGGFTLRAMTGTGTDQTRRAGAYTGATDNISAAITPGVNSPWTQYKLTFNVPTNATQIGFYLIWTPTGTAGANDYFETTGWQLDIGPTAMLHQEINYDHRFSACERRLQKSFALSQPPVQNLGSSAGAYRMTAVAAGAVTVRGPHIPFQTRMRIIPTVTTYSPAAATAEVYDSTAGIACTNTATVRSESGFLTVCTQGAGVAAGDSLAVHWLADARF